MRTSPQKIREEIARSKLNRKQIKSSSHHKPKAEVIDLTEDSPMSHNAEQSQTLKDFFTSFDPTPTPASGPTAPSLHSVRVELQAGVQPCSVVVDRCIEGCLQDGCTLYDQVTNKLLSPNTTRNKGFFSARYSTAPARPGGTAAKRLKVLLPVSNSRTLGTLRLPGTSPTIDGDKKHKHMEGPAK